MLCTCRLNTEYPISNMFKLFMCAVCQLEMRPGEGISLRASSPKPSGVSPWDGPFLCLTCQAKKEAMEGKPPSGSNNSYLFYTTRKNIGSLNSLRPSLISTTSVDFQFNNLVPEVVLQNNLLLLIYFRVSRWLPRRTGLRD